MLDEEIDIDKKALRLAARSAFSRTAPTGHVQLLVHEAELEFNHQFIATQQSLR
ncbi:MULTISPECIES: hypothetical protein [Burkholderia]|uniref:hypothetical protein n=1 Tax=Burkholderia TaxID=32008 RepID=UPI001AEB50E3|nr:hypothetical protein [Burkholderia sp. AcTa6-5]MBP0714790.1 hypothetical protein [Burkholderia sp. AcTa6-5]